MSNYVFVTSNKNKAKEINEILGSGIKVKALDLPEIQSLNLDEVITAKAKAAYVILKKPVIVEDISFEIQALNNLPGTLVKFFMQRLGSEGTAKLVKSKNRQTTITAAVAIYNGAKLKIFKGTVHGKLSTKNRGTSGFAFDHIFIPSGHKKTYAEMPQELKNKISHRAKALKLLKKYLERSTS